MTHQIVDAWMLTVSPELRVCSFNKQDINHDGNTLKQGEGTAPSFSVRNL